MTTFIIESEGQQTTLAGDVALDDERLRLLIAAHYPWLANAAITRHPEVDGVVKITLTKRAGTKGSDPIVHLNTCPGGENPTIALYREVQDLDLAAIAPEEALAFDARLRQALEEGENQKKRMDSAQGRLATAQPQAARLLVVGF